MLTDRMMRAARLDGSLYREVKTDSGATSEALIVVVLGALASGIASGIGFILAGKAGLAFTGLIGGVVSGLVGWAVLSLVAYYVGTRGFGGKATAMETMRAIGFAYSPNVATILGFLPVVGGLVRIVVSFWILVTGVIAIRESMEMDTTKAILTGLVSVVAMLIVGGLLALMGLGVALNAGIK